MKCFSQLRFIYRQQLNNEMALACAEKLYELGRRASMLDPWYVMDAATSYLLSGDTTESILLMNEAYGMIADEDNDRKNIPILTGLLSTLSKTGEQEKACSVAHRLRNLDGLYKPHNYDLNFGIYYLQKGEADSAAQHFKRVFDNTDRMASRCDAAKELMRYYHDSGDYRKAADYALAFQQANDSVIRERQFDLTRNAQAEYHYQRDKAAEEVLVRHSERTRLWAIVGGLVCVIAIQTMIVTFFYRKKQMQETIIGKEKEIGKARYRIAQQEKELEEKNDELNTLERKQEEAKRLLLDAERQLAQTKERLKDKIAQNDDLMQLILTGRVVENQAFARTHLAHCLSHSNRSDTDGDSQNHEHHSPFFFFFLRPSPTICRPFLEFLFT